MLAKGISRGYSWFHDVALGIEICVDLVRKNILYSICYTNA
jgi:hypothetical protein